jgi:hypothetical protein
MRIHRKKLKLRGFNNLTKSLSFNIYDICYAKSRVDRKEYLAYVDEVYNSERLESILKGMADLIGGRHPPGSQVFVTFRRPPHGRPRPQRTVPVHRQFRA